MHTSYHAFAGQSVQRLAALSDGIFAVARTLLVAVQLNYAVAPRLPGRCRS
jgi:hypothetical protein